MKIKQFRIEHGLYLVAFAVALFTHILALGSLPLGDGEAKLSLQALEIARNQPTLYQGGHSLYLTLTTLFFFLFGSTNFLARLVPALAGAALSLVPALFRDKIGAKAALILAFLLALDPGMIAISRMTTGQTMAVLFLAGAYAFFERRKAALCGMFLGLALLSGPAIWAGILALAVSVLIARNILKPVESDEAPAPVGPLDWKKGVVWAGGTVLVAGSLGMFVPEGLSSAGLGLVDYWQGWFSTSGVSFSHLIVALLGYELLLLVLSLVQAVRGFLGRSNLDRFLFTWWAVGLVLALVNPSRQVVDLLWCLVPMLVLAARLLAVLLDFDFEFSRVAVFYTLVVAAVAAFLFLDLLSVLGPLHGESDEKLRLVRVVVGAFLLFTSGFAIYLLWGGQPAWKGLALGVVAVMAVFSLSGAWAAAGLGNDPAAQLWRSDSLFDEQDIFMESVRQVDATTNHIPNSSDIVVQGIDSPALRWTLRDENDAIFSDTIPVDATPSILITADQPAVSQPAEYTGQDFTLVKETNWGLLLPNEWLRWFLLKTAPEEKSSIVLWVRTDLFPAVAASN